MTMLEAVLNRTEDTQLNPACPMCGVLEDHIDSERLFVRTQTEMMIKTDALEGGYYADFMPAHVVWQCGNCGQKVGAYLYSVRDDL